MNESESQRKAVRRRFENDRIATFECDDRDDPKRGALYIRESDDWYVSVGLAEHGKPPMGPSVRFCCSGSKHSDEVRVAIALLHALGTGQRRLAHTRARALAEMLESK